MLAEREMCIAAGAEAGGIVSVGEDAQGFVGLAGVEQQPRETLLHHAGQLGIRLGGPNDYFGQRVEKPWIGDATRDISVDDISRTIRLMWVSSTLALALFMAVRYWLVGAA